MGALSDQLLVVTILTYLAAMLAFAAEYALAARPPANRELVAVGAAGPSSDLGQLEPPEGVLATKISERWGRVGVAVTGFGVLAHAGVLLARGVAAQRVPWGNMYEFVLTVGLVGAVAWLVLLVRQPVARHFGLLVTLTLTGLVALAGSRLYTSVAPLVPALDSYWLKIHVTAMAIATGIFLVGFVGATTHLIRSGYDAGKRRFPYPMGRRLPAADALERLTFRVHAVGFPIWTFGVICGAIWAESAWGRYWGWDPKETWSFISWVVYAGYLHARATPSVRRTTVAWIAIAGWVTMLVNLYGVNLVIAGLHSYAGVK